MDQVMRVAEPVSTVIGRRQHRNSAKLTQAADPMWTRAKENGLAGLYVDSDSSNRLTVRESGNRFINLSSCSYLGLNQQPAVIQGAIDALSGVGTTWLAIAGTRIKHALAGRLEDELGDLFGCQALPGLSCSALTAGILPLLASGQLEDGEPRVMVFDRFCHFSMAYLKPTCADETLVLTCDHNDLAALEDICRRYPRVAYVCDGAYSTGGSVALGGLLELQKRYGLFLYIDDSHSLSILGARGEGFARSQVELNPLTVIVASLSKGFGSGGGVAMLSNRWMFDRIQRHGGPVGWSQTVGTAVIGAALASAEIHRSPLLGELQQKLAANIRLFDELMPTAHAGSELPVRRIPVGAAEDAVRLSAEMLKRGYYTSAIFFPIVAKGEASLRVMLNATLTAEDIRSFCAHLAEVTEGLTPPGGDRDG
jgi:7-keto-8-aminopelargonate synthetase-like enzyme